MIKLSSETLGDEAEALLVFEGLAKLEEKLILDTAITDEERSAFWALEAVLEKSLPVFAADYAALVSSDVKIPNFRRGQLTRRFRQSVRERLITRFKFHQSSC